MDPISLPLKGAVKEIEKHIEWKIPDIFKDQGFSYESPTFTTPNHVWNFNLRSTQFDRIEFSISNNLKLKYSLVYFLELERNGQMLRAHIGSGIMDVGTMHSSWKTLITKTELLRRKTELAPSNVLTIVCRLSWKSDIHESVEPPKLNQGDHAVKLNGFDKLSENFKDLFADKESTDVTLKVQDREFKAHKLILMARCSVFAAIFKSDTKETKTKAITVTDCDAKTFQDFLKYLYYGKIEKLSLQSAMKLYYTAYKYDVTELREFCTEIIKQNMKVNSLFEIASVAIKCEDPHLFRVVQNFFNANTTKIFETTEWESLMQNDFCLGNKLLRGMSGNVTLRNDNPQQAQKNKKKRRY